VDTLILIMWFRFRSFNTLMQVLRVNYSLNQGRTRV